jgi:hypothetical protein
MARRTAADAPCALVQVIELRWDKSARGGAAARARAAVPEAFEVPPRDLTGPGGMLCIETTAWGEHNSFAEPFSARRHRKPLAEGFSFRAINVSMHDGHLQVLYEYDPSTCGAPDRRYEVPPGGDLQRPRSTLVVGSGEWVRIQYSGRFSCIDTGHWWYEQVTANVAWFETEPNGRVFLNRNPVQQLSLLAELW